MADTPQRIAAVGLPNSGKSLLLSAIADVDSLFPSGPKAGMTEDFQCAQWECALLVDTPSLDYHRRNAGSLAPSIPQNDVLLWCHSLRGGELTAVERDLIQYFADRPQRSIILVLTHKDDIVRSIDESVIRNRISEQLLPIRTGDSDADGDHPELFTVGLRTYFNARTRLREGAAKLAAHSGVPHLRRAIQRYLQPKQEPL